MTTQVLRSIRRAGFGLAAALFVIAAAPLTAQGAAATYAYDTRGRVSSITYDDGTVVDYAYDANGNRTGATRTTPPPDTSPRRRRVVPRSRTSR